MSLSEPVHACPTSEEARQDGTGRRQPGGPQGVEHGIEHGVADSGAWRHRRQTPPALAAHHRHIVLPATSPRARVRVCVCAMHFAEGSNNAAALGSALR